MLGVVAALVAAVLAWVVPGVAPAGAAARTDLAVSGGSFEQDGEEVTARFRIGARRADAPPARAGLGLWNEDHGWLELSSAKIRRIDAGSSRRVVLGGDVTGASPGDYDLTACADYAERVAERNEANNCLVLGTVTVEGSGLCDTPACDPIQVETDTVVEYNDSTGKYWVFVPEDALDGPFGVLIWLHGCGGQSAGDVWNVADYWDQHYITIAPDGAENGCWDAEAETGDDSPARVVDTVRSVIAHFLVDPRRIVLGGYSSGGDLSYKSAFCHNDLFAGVIAINTAPFRDNGGNETRACMADAPWKFNTVHLAHTGDGTYPIELVRSEVQEMKDAGFPVELIERPGGHWDDATDPQNPQDGTAWEIQQLVKEHMDDGWTAPAG